MSATERSTVAFLDLPEEILIKILCDCRLDAAADLIYCSKVCRSLNAIIKDTPCLTYLVELARAGMKEGPPGGLSLEERVKSVRQYTNAMTTGQLPYRFLGLVRSQDPQDPLWMGDSIVFTNLDALGCFKILRPASFFSGVVENVWCIDARPVIYNLPPVNPWHPWTSFTVDVGQDLFILTKRGYQNHNGVPGLDQTYPECHLLSISQGGAPHPLAAQVKLEALLDYGYFEENIEIAGDLLVWTIMHVSQTASHNVFNWKTGKCVWRGHTNNGIYHMKCYLLDASRLVEVSERRLFIYNFGASEHEKHYLELELPRVEVWDGMITGSMVHRASSFFYCSPTFEEDPDLTVLVFTDRTDEGAPVTGEVIVIIPLLNIVDLAVRTELESPQPRTEPRVLKWDEWGPENARVVFSPQYKAVVSCMAGPRVSLAVPVYPTEPEDTISEIDVYTLDVRPRGRGVPRRSIEEYAGPDSAIWIADSCGFHVEGIFEEEPVRSAAPCRVTRQRITLGDRLPLVTMPRLFHDGLLFLEHPPED